MTATASSLVMEDASWDLKHIPHKPLSLPIALQTIGHIQVKMDSIISESPENTVNLNTKQDVADILQSMRKFSQSTWSLVRRMQKSRQFQQSGETLNLVAFHDFSAFIISYLHKLPKGLLTQLLLLRICNLVVQEFASLYAICESDVQLGLVHCLIFSDFSVVRLECVNILTSSLLFSLPETKANEFLNLSRNLLSHDKVVPRLRGAVGYAYLVHNSPSLVNMFATSNINGHLNSEHLDIFAELFSNLRSFLPGTGDEKALLSKQDWIRLHGYSETLACMLSIKIIDSDKGGIIFDQLCLILDYVSSKAKQFWSIHDTSREADEENDDDDQQETLETESHDEIVKSCCWRTLTACISAMTQILLQHQVFQTDLIHTFDTIQKYIKDAMVFIRHWGVSQHITLEFKRVCVFILDKKPVEARNVLSLLVKVLWNEFSHSKPNPRKDQRYIGHTRMIRVLLCSLDISKAKEVCDNIISECEHIILSEDVDNISRKENAISTLLAFTQDTQVSYWMCFSRMFLLCCESIKRKIPGSFVLYGSVLPRLIRGLDTVPMRGIASSLLGLMSLPLSQNLNFYETQIFPWLLFFKYVKSHTLLSLLGEHGVNKDILLQWLSNLNAHSISAHIRILAADILCLQFHFQDCVDLIQIRSDSSSRTCNSAHGVLVLISFLFPLITRQTQKDNLLQILNTFEMSYHDCPPLIDMIQRVMQELSPTPQCT